MSTVTPCTSFRSDRWRNADQAYEAMAMAKPIVSTRIVWKGFPCGTPTIWYLRPSRRLRGRGSAPPEGPCGAHRARGPRTGLRQDPRQLAHAGRSSPARVAPWRGRKRVPRGHSPGPRRCIASPCTRKLLARLLPEWLFARLAERHYLRVVRSFFAPEAPLFAQLVDRGDHVATSAPTSAGTRGSSRRQ